MPQETSSISSDVKYSSRIDGLFQGVFIFSTLLLLGTSVGLYVAGKSQTSHLIFHAINGLCIGLLIWSYKDTHYEIKGDALRYKSGPIKGQIPIAAIRKVEVGVTQWTGMKKMGLARRGLIITYHTYDDLYITPPSNEEFVAALLKLNPQIQVVR